MDTHNIWIRFSTAGHMVSTASRRRRILLDQKWPSDFIVPLYTEAQEIIAGYLRRRSIDESLIENEINRLLRMRGKTDWEKQRLNLCIDALKSFMNVSSDLKLGKYQLRQTGNRQPKLTKERVAVSVRPELCARVKGVDGTESAGCIKLYFSKTNPLARDAANYVGVLLHEFAEKFVQPLKTAIPRDCLVIDVFAERIYEAPNATKKRLRELGDACSEIAAVWGSIAQPKEQVKYRTSRPRVKTG